MAPDIAPSISCLLNGLDDGAFSSLIRLRSATCDKISFVKSRLLDWSGGCWQTRQSSNEVSGDPVSRHHYLTVMEGEMELYVVNSLEGKYSI